MEHLKFLTSTRFWAVVIIALSFQLSDMGLISDRLFEFLSMIAGGHIGIRTVDRFGEQGVNSQ